MDNYEQLVYWIRERYDVYLKKEIERKPKPWSSDPVFQRVYFCNVHRENDRVTKWIRQSYRVLGLTTCNPEFNMLLARFVNKPSSLDAMNWPFRGWGWEEQQRFLNVMSQKGAWNGAYIVSTNGVSAPKHDYICDLLSAAWSRLNGGTLGVAYPTLRATHTALQGLSGVASFMAGQVVADLKNTEGHPLAKAPDWWTWSCPGPGSLRGMSWVHECEKTTPKQFEWLMPRLRERIDQETVLRDIPQFCNQDLQNCLCEFDKFMRVKNGTGRSKRKYNGTNS